MIAVIVLIMMKIYVLTVRGTVNIYIKAVAIQTRIIWLILILI